MIESISAPKPLVDGLREAMEATGLVAHSTFESLVPRAVNWVLVDRDNGILARVREIDVYPLERVEANLGHVSAAVAAGAPICPPVVPEVLVFGNRQEYAATFWPLGDNRLVTPKEMAEVILNIHATPPPPGLKPWLEVRHSKDRNRVEWLRNLSDPPSESVIAECAALVDEALGRLEQLLKGSRRVLLHGDSHPQNIIELNGRMVACDLDEISVGPPEADLSLPFVHARRYPDCDPEMGNRLLGAYGEPINQDLLEAIIHARTCAKLVGLGQSWRPRGEEEPGTTESLLQRLDAIKDGGKFARLHGEEGPTRFAD